MDSIVPEYAWEAVTLPYLFRQLGMTSRYKAAQISGCLTLLECWIYVYFPMFAREPSPAWRPGTPRPLRWKDNHRVRNSNLGELQTIRKQLDNLTADQVTWTPYGPPANIPRVSLYHGCLRFMDIVEAYVPDRVARQFGRVHGIPRRAISMGRKTRLTPKAVTYKKKYGHADEYWEQIAQHTYTFRDLGGEARIAGQASPEYTQWHESTTHPMVHNPMHGPTDRYLDTMHTATEHRLQPLRQELISVSQQALGYPNVPDYVRDSLHNMNRYAGTGGFPGVHATPMHRWWGQPDRLLEEQYRQPLDPGWSAYPGYEYGNPSFNPDEDNSE